MATKKTALAAPRIDHRILIIRGERVMLDTDLAELYGVPTKALNQAVKRNAERFPEDFMFQLSAQEFAIWRSQIVTSNPGAKMGLRRPPYAFTEHGAIQAANVLSSPRAAEMSVHVVRAFVRMRELIAQNKEIAKKLAQLEGRIDGLDETVVEIVQAVRELMAAPTSSPAPNDNKPKRRIGFV